MAETIQALNDNDTLEPLKKTLPGAGSCVQVGVSTATMQARAISAHNDARANGHLPQINIATNKADQKP